MAWIDGNARRVFGPAVPAVLLRGHPLAGVEALGAVVRHEEGGKGRFQGLMGLILGVLTRRFRAGALPALHRAMRPGRVGCGQPRGEGGRRTDSGHEGCEGLLSRRTRAPLAARLGEHRVPVVRHHRQAMAEERGRERVHGRRVARGSDALRWTGEGGQEGARAFCGTPCGTRAVAGAARSARARLRLWRGARALWAAAAAVPRPPTVACGARQAGQGRWQGRQALSSGP